jgi:hypothetical protein
MISDLKLRALLDLCCLIEMQESGRLETASKLYEKALSVESTINSRCLLQRASLLDSKAFLEYRKGNLPEAISNLQASLEIKLKLKKFGAVPEMQLAISHLLRWRSREIILSRDVKFKKRLPCSPPTVRKGSKVPKSTLCRKAMIYDAEV